MEKLRNAVFAFFVFNCLSLAVFAACANSVTVNSMSCSLSSETKSFCFYICPNGGLYSEPKPKEEGGGDDPFGTKP